MPPKYLINSETLQLEHGTKLVIPNTRPKEYVKYAILSHCWGDEDQEVSFDDMQLDFDSVKYKLGYKKLEYACIQAFNDGYSHIWIDTCCIDKKSSADLSESINSMYSWYEQAEQCYAYLEDIEGVDNMGQSEWFNRGWTLQELIAPKVVVFFSQSWLRLGERADLCQALSDITRIDIGVLSGTEKVDSVSVARRMSWASKRLTSRPEDVAYCLMGIFNVNMTMIYGEGDKAFIRLQEEIMKDSDDESIFAWRDRDASSDTLTGLLAIHPRMFEDSRGCIAYDGWWEPRSTYTKTNHGLEISLPLRPFDQGIYTAALNCPMPNTQSGFIGIFLKRLNPDLDLKTKQQYARTRVHDFWQGHITDRGQVSTFFVRKPDSDLATYGIYPSHVVQLGKGPVAADGFTLMYSSGHFSEAQLSTSGRGWIPHEVRTSFNLNKTENKVAGALIFQRDDESFFTFFLASFPARGTVGVRLLDHEWLCTEVKTLDDFFILTPGPGAHSESEFERFHCRLNVRAEAGVKYYIVDITIEDKRPRPRTTFSFLSKLPDGQTTTITVGLFPRPLPHVPPEGLRKLLSRLDGRIHH